MIYKTLNYILTITAKLIKRATNKVVELFPRQEAQVGMLLAA